MDPRWGSLLLLWIPDAVGEPLLDVAFAVQDRAHRRVEVRRPLAPMAQDCEVVLFEGVFFCDLLRCEKLVVGSEEGHRVIRFHKFGLQEPVKDDITRL